METTTIEHDPEERPRTDWRRYRRVVLAGLHANHAQFETEATEPHQKATLRLAQALQPAFVVWCASEFGQHETKREDAYKAFAYAMPWFFAHLGDLIQGPNGPELMANALLDSVKSELEAFLREGNEPDGAAAPPTAGTA